jgi:hypothetical protein
MPEMLALATALALGLSVADAADAPRFGQPITPADLAPWNISIAPDGVGLPPDAEHPSGYSGSVGAVGVRRANARGTHSEPRPNQLASGEDHDTPNEEQKDRDG